MRKVDSVIVGQGLAGTLLAFQLLGRGQKILVIDAPRENSSSKVAAGLYNPVTGQRTVKTWLVEALFPFLEKTYTELENFLETKFLYQVPILRPLDSIAEQNEWMAQSTEPSYKDWLDMDIESHAEQGLSFPFGSLRTKFSGYVDLKVLLASFRAHLVGKDSLQESVFDYERLQVKEDSIQYEQIVADQIVFCEGAYGRSNPFFDYLPLNGTKGEVLDLNIKEYSAPFIVSKGIFVIPKEGRQTVGSNYEWTYEHDRPSEYGLNQIRPKLEKVVKSPYEILSHKAGIRPTVKDHRPLIGRHPLWSNVYIFNGMGTKGVSLAPYFSDQLAAHLMEGRNLMEEVDIQRFHYLYQSKQQPFAR